MREGAASFLSLFTSTSTLICCALPAVFVSLGAGASFASLIGFFPMLPMLSTYKIEITVAALVMLIASGLINRRTARLPCPIEPGAAKACMQTRRRSAVTWWFSVAIFSGASLFTYLVPLWM